MEKGWEIVGIPSQSFPDGATVVGDEECSASEDEEDDSGIA